MGVFGKSGCGKTSLLEYLFREFRKKEQVAYMKQDILLPPELTVYETLWFYTRLRCPEECSSIGLVLEKMNISSLADTKVQSLSGGEKKRVMLAYHLLDERSHFFLLDEPFSGIDPINTELIFFLMREKTIHRPCTIVMTIHQIHPLIQQQLDETWTFVPSSHLDCFQLEITSSIMEEEETFSDISLNDFSSPPSKKNIPSHYIFFSMEIFIFTGSSHGSSEPLSCFFTMDNPSFRRISPETYHGIFSTIFFTMGISS